MDGLAQDLRLALRQIARRPGFYAVCIATLALAIGANAVVFGVFHSVVLEPLPYEAPDRLVRFFSTRLDDGIDSAGVSPADAADYRAGLDGFERLGFYTYWGLSFSDSARPREITVVRVTPGLLATLGVEPLHGRTFLPREETEGNERVVVLSHALWQTEFGGDPAVVGTTVRLDGAQWTIVGVMPPGFDFPVSGAEMWAPMTELGLDNRARRGLMALGRLAPGVGLDAAEAEAQALAASLAGEHPEENAGWSVRLVPFAETVVAEVRPALVTLVAAVAFLLLLAAVNISNLMLTRGLGRGHEIAVRAALGAGRLRVVRLVGVEALLLAAVGGVLGVLLAVWGLEAVVRWGPSDVPRLESIELSLSTLGFTVAAAVGAALLIGLLTALALLRLTPADSLSSGRRGSLDRGEKRLRGALTVAELALSLVLVLGAGLMVRSLWTLLDVDPGFRTEGTAAVQLFAYGDRYDGPQAWRAFTDELIARLETHPGVEAAGAVNSLPMNVLFGGSMQVQVAGRAEPESVPAGYRTATPGYFPAMRIPLVAGRSLSAADRADAPPVALVNETAAATYFPDGGAIDRRLVIGEDEMTIVGVVGDLHHLDLETTPAPEIFFPYAQRPTGTLSIVAATDGAAADLLEPMRAAVWAIDPLQPIFRSYVIADLVDYTTAGRRFYTALLTAFAALAALVAAIGLYGVVSYSVAQRTREFGIRMTLGARAADVARLVLDQGTRLAAVGVVLGLAGGLLLMRLAQGLLYGVSASDPLTVAAVAALFTALALAASWLPARRAVRIDPIAAIRSE